MTDYPVYCSAAGITSKQMTDTIRAEFPKFSKIQKSMICQPDKYGVCLLPEAEALLIAAYGVAPGLNTPDPASPGERDAFIPPQTARLSRAPHRTKPHRLVVYLSDDLNTSVRGLMTRLGFSTVQDFLCTTLTEIIKITEAQT